MCVVLIHGMFSSTRCWDRVCGGLHEQGIQAETLSLHPNGIPKDGRGFEDVAVSLRTQIEGLGSQPTVLVGHSLGALLVEKLLSAFPLARAVLVNPSPGWGHLGPVYPLWVAARRGLFWRRTIQLDADECHRLLFQGMARKEFETALQTIEPESGELVRQVFWFFDLLGAATRIQRKPTSKVSVLTGTLDPTATPAYCQHLASQYGHGVRADVIDHVGHTSILQEAAIELIVERISASHAAQTRSNLSR